MNVTASKVLGPESDPYISKYMETHQGAAPAIRQAWNKLAGEPDVGQAVRKLLPALTSKTLNIFFSYKKKDEAAASGYAMKYRAQTGLFFFYPILLTPGIGVFTRPASSIADQHQRTD
jgi:hypothetical protein